MKEGAKPAAVENILHRLPPGRERDGPLVLQETVANDGDLNPTPIVLLHGATFGSAMFDIPVPGYSLQRFLASSGWRSFAMDVRGYGRSMPAKVMDDPPENNKPYAPLSAAVDDLEDVVDFVLDHVGAEQAHIIGFSWGTVATCAFAAARPGQIASLVLYAPLYAEINKRWIDLIADPDDPSQVNARLGAYRWVGEEDIRGRWDADYPGTGKANAHREERVLQAIVDCLAETDPKERQEGQRSFRAPTGALVDLFEVFNGRPLYDPSKVLAPTLIVRGEGDKTSTRSDAQTLFGALGASDKRYVSISPGSHFLCAERNSGELFSHIELFLNRCKQTSS